MKMGRRLPDRSRIHSDMLPPSASPARTALPAVHFERNDFTIICETVHKITVKSSGTRRMIYTFFQKVNQKQTVADFVDSGR
jgi:hypothetical protein